MLGRSIYFFLSTPMLLLLLSLQNSDSCSQISQDTKHLLQGTTYIQFSLNFTGGSTLTCSVMLHTNTHGAKSFATELKTGKWIPLRHMHRQHKSLESSVLIQRVTFLLDKLHIIFHMGPVLSHIWKQQDQISRNRIVACYILNLRWKWLNTSHHH